MPYADDQVDRLSRWFVYLADSVMKSGLVYGLVLYHWVTSAYTNVYTLTHKTLRGAINAHKNEEFVFLSRNSVPWVRHEDAEELGVIRIQYPMVYHVNSSEFTFRSGCGDSEPYRCFDDVVTAELVNTDETLVYDLSELFHSVSWEKGGAPTLYEMGLLYCLLNNLLFTKDQMSGFRLRILTANADEIEQRFDSTRSLSEFTKWEDYMEKEERTPTATSKASDAQVKEDEEESHLDENHESPPMTREEIANILYSPPNEA